MDDKEDPLGKISRQLSEMGPVPNMPMSGDGATPPNLMGDQWTQFGQDARQMPFHNLYTWNSLDLPDKRISQPGSQHPHDYNSQEIPPQSVFRGYGQNANSWSGNGHHFAPHRFPDQDLLPRRTPQDGMDPMTFEHAPVQGMSFHGDSVSPVVAPHSPMQRDYFSNSNMSSQLPDLMRRSSQPARMYSASFGSDRMGSSEFFTPDHLAHPPSPPLFDPSTPPPPFLVQRQHSDSSVRLQNLTGDTDIFSQSQINKSKLNIDLGTNIESPSVSFTGSVDTYPDSEEGRQLYKAAMERWDSTESASPSERNNVVPIGVGQETSVTDKSKPSYSDIAKTPKNSSQPTPTKSESQTLEDPAKTTPRLQRKDLKAFRPLIRRTSSGSKFLPRGSSDQSKGQVASRYGLDNFSENTVVSLSSSSESLSHATRTRRDSGSSAGSSISALDDIALSSTPDTLALGKERDVEQKGTSLGTTKSSKTAAKASPKTAAGEKEHVFFDPKRIFQSKSSSKPQAPTGAVPKAKLNTGPAEPYVPSGTTSSTLLNNGKPTAGSASAKLSSSAKQHDYINNDLRDANKLTNKTAEEIAHGGAGPSGNQMEGNHKFEREHRAGKRSGNRVSMLLAAKL